jgi:TfoX/Sxy family transcriptional regulator of competence genes
VFGGPCFTLNGNMVAGVVDNKLILRVGPENHEATLKLKHAQPMDFTGKPMTGMVYVEPEGCETQTSTKTWIKRALKLASSLPAK